MNILYYSVHQVLEYDEVRLFRHMGHHVVTLGANSPAGASQNFRDPICFNEEELRLYKLYDTLGGDYFHNREKIFPPGFVENFDFVIVMHDVGIICEHWKDLRKTNVIWRTIGQGVDAFEVALKPYRDDGLKIVRYSPIEDGLPGGLGQDAIIRFGKDPTVFGSWSGSTQSALIFSNQYRQRYPNDAADYEAIAREVDISLGGSENETLPNAIGFCTFDQQLELYRSRSAYLYASGLGIPYTLNFIEAWMTGIPLVVHAPIERRGPFLEIPQLIDNGVDGFVCDHVSDTIDALQYLLSNREAAKAISAAGRRSAIAAFGVEQIASDWNQLLSQCSRR